MMALTDRIGRQERTIDLELVRRMSATLDRKDSWHNGEVSPVDWHWPFFNEIGRQPTVGADGHPQRGTFLPPVTQPVAWRCRPMCRSFFPVTISTL